MSMERVRARVRREDGFTLVEVLVTISLLVIASGFIGGAIVQALHTKVSSRQLAVAVNWVRAVDKAAGAADYADLGFYTGQQGAPTSIAPILVPANSDGTSLSEHPIVLGDGTPVRSTSFTVDPAVSVAPAAPDPNDSAPLSDAGASYKIETWVTAAAPLDGTTVSPGKRVTVRVQWGPDPSQFDGSCKGGVRCTVQSIIRPADAATANPVGGGDAGSPCASASPAVCDTYVRSGRVLGFPDLSEGGTAPAQIDDVDMSARTTQRATSVTASWTFTTATGPLTITQPLTGDETGTRWAATVPKDDLTSSTGQQVKGKIRPGRVSVAFAAAFDGASATASTTAAWSYGIPNSAIGAHVTASLASPAPTDASWCSSSGTGTPVVAHVTGLSVGFTETARPTSADDRVDFLFTVTDPGGTTRAVSVPATVVPGSVSSMTGTQVDNHGNHFAFAAVADWSAVAPASSDCTPGATVLVRVQRAADQSTTVIPLQLARVASAFPTVPANLRVVSVAGGSAVVAWDPAPAAASYVITVDGADTPVTGTQTTVTGTYGGTASVTVKSVNTLGVSAPSQPLTVSFSPLASAPVVTASRAANQATFSWTAVPGAVSYRVSPVVNGTAQAPTTTSSTTATLAVDRGQTTSVQVVSVDGTQASSLPGSASVTAPLWDTLTLQNSWANYGSPFSTARYTRTPAGVVVVSGLVRYGSITPGTVIGTLPPGYRPAGGFLIFVQPTADATYVRMDVGTDGRIVLGQNSSVPATAGGFLSLDGIEFLAADAPVSRTALTYQNGWSAYDTTGTWAAPTSALDALGRVHLQGLMKPGTIGSTIAAALPGYPSGTNPQYLPLLGNNGFGSVVLTNSGIFTTSYTPASFDSLRGLYYQSPSSYQTIPLQNGWLEHAGYPPASWVKGSDGLVSLRGIVDSGSVANGTVLGVLPAGARPDSRLIFTVDNNDGYGRIDVLPTGEIVVGLPATSGWLSLDGINFVAGN